MKKESKELKSKKNILKKEIISPFKHKRRKKILIIEDNIDTMELLCIMLNNKGYHVLQAYDGKTGLNILKQRHIDMILLDIMLPDISGEVVLKNIRRKEEYDKVKIIVLTAVRFSANEQEAFITKGAQKFMNKPVSVEVLEKEIRKQLRKR